MDKPTVGRIVHARVKFSEGDPDSDYRPMLVVSVHTDCVMGQVFLRPSDSATTIVKRHTEGAARKINRAQLYVAAKGPPDVLVGSWRWPPRA